MKKVLIFAYFLLISLCLMSPRISHATDQIYDIHLGSSHDISSAHGLHFQYDVSLVDQYDITAYQLKFNYNPNYFQVENIILDPTIESSVVFNTTIHGTVIISFASVSAPIIGEEILFSIEFKVIEDLPIGHYEVLTIDPYYNNEFVRINDEQILQSSHSILTEFDDISIITYGDLNKDEVVSILDANIIQLYLAQLSDPSDHEIDLYDINQDGAVNLIDVAKIQLYVSQLINQLQPEHINVDPYPIFSENEQIYTNQEEGFDPLYGISASSFDGVDLTAHIQVLEYEIDFDRPGTYVINYRVIDENLTTEYMRLIYVIDKFQLADYQEGIDLSFLPADQKAVFFAATERYLLSNVYGGVPLYRLANYNMYDNRVELYSSIYNGVMGFGLDLSYLTLDDSHVLFEQDTYGNAQEYTLRNGYMYEPDSLNPWIAEDPSSYDFIDLFSGDLYDFAFDETKTGFEIIPNLALSEPVPVNPVEINGMIYSDIWQIELRDDLSWKFHPSTNLSGLTQGYQNLDASDFIWTFKEAIDQEWFRAISGGSDFVSQGIKNINEYMNGSVPWSEVGLSLADENSNVIELEYSSLKTAFDIKYNYSMGQIQPINKELYEALGGTSGYGLDPLSVASSGVYYLDAWDEMDQLQFKKNELYPHHENYQYTGLSYKYYDSLDLIFQGFLDGYLDYTSVPSAQIYDYLSDDRMIAIPQTTVWRMSMNSFGTEENRDQYILDHPDVYINPNFVPEPILMYKEMRQAFYLGIDRDFSQQGLVTRYVPEHMLIPETYFIDYYSGLSVRGTAVGKDVYDDFFFENYGYSPTYALQLFKHAVYMAIEDGYYVAGTESDYQTIELTFTYSSSGNQYVQAVVNNIVEQYETLFVDDENYVNIDIIVHDIAFPSSYQEYNQTANTDLGLVGISGSILGPFNYLETFCDDNRGGFTLNWGIDTSTPNIKVEYTNFEGELVHEIWSFNAITAALQGFTYIKDGIEQNSWDQPEDLIESYLVLEDDTLDSISVDHEITVAIFGDLEDLAEEHDVDQIVSFISISENGHQDLFVLSVKDGSYGYIDRISLSTDLINSIERFIAFEFQIIVEITDAQGPLTDQEILENEYLVENYDYNSKLQIALDQDILLQFVSIQDVEVYATTVDFNGNVWDDVTVVLHIGDYYITWRWL